jgi:hypothetical protein
MTPKTQSNASVTRDEELPPLRPNVGRYMNDVKILQYPMVLPPTIFLKDN